MYCLNTVQCIWVIIGFLYAYAIPIWASEASQRRSGEGLAKGELATIPYKFSFVLRPDEGKYHWMRNDVPEIKVE